MLMQLHPCGQTWEKLRTVLSCLCYNDTRHFHVSYLYSAASILNTTNTRTKHQYVDVSYVHFEP